MKNAKNLLRYVLLAALVGVIVGAVDALFGRVLIAISDFRTGHALFLIPFLPLAGLLIVWMYHRFSKESLGGMTLIFETGLNRRESIPVALIPLVMLGTWITHLFGGSAGREGVAVQIGATVSHTFGRKMHLPDNSRVMLVTGMAAGFAGLFQTPLAATFFAMEVIIAGFLDYEALLPALVASYIASGVSHALGLEKFTADISDTIPLTDARHVAALLVMGAAFGLAGFCFSFFLGKMKKQMAKKFENPYKRIAFVAIPLAAVLLILWQGRYSGLGTNLISASFSGGTIFAWDWILKLLLTLVTLSIGFQGGEVTPLFAIGSSLGAVLGSLFGLPVTVCAALGYAAVFGSATNTLIAPVLIGLEVFGPQNMTAFLIVCAVAYILNGNCSIYSAQQSARELLKKAQK